MLRYLYDSYCQEPGMNIVEALLLDKSKSVLRAVDRSFAVISFSLDGTILEANKIFLDTTGYTPDEVIGKRHRMFMPDGDAGGPDYEAFWNALRQGIFQAGEFRRVGKAGREIWLRATYSPVLNRAGKPVRVVKIASDVTAEKLKSIKDAGQIAAINRSQAVISFKPDGTILDANDNFLSVMGYRLDEIVGRHHRMFVAPAEATLPQYEGFWAALRRGEFQAAEYRRIGKGGREVWIRATYNPILGGDGQVLQVVKFAVDVTEEKRRNADYEGQILAINKTQAVITFRLDGHIIDANKNFLNATGYTIEEVRGKHHRLFVEPSYAGSPDYKAFWDRLASGESLSAIYQRYGKGGRRIWLQATYNPILDASGMPFKVVKYATDITANMGARTNAVNSVEETLNTVEAVARAAEQMNSSAANIVTTMARSKAVVDDISDRARAADQSTMNMKQTAQSMGDVVQLIAKVAEQINLLALNATIESARAGEAGRGFAVVATEVKNLAGQASNATSRITTEIAAMRSASDDVVGALMSISSSISDVQQFVDNAARSVEDQSITTREIFGNMQSAADGVADIGRSLDDWIIGMEERRFDERRRTYQSATIIVPGKAPVTCSVRNISKSGAKLALNNAKAVADEFDLQIAGERDVRRCGVVRRLDNELGIHFLEAAQATHKGVA